jgi:hypothetical protein
MATLDSRSFDSPDEVRKFADHGQAEVLQLDGRTVLRSVFEPGWVWSKDVKPIAGTDSCQSRHFGYMVSGRLKVVMDDGTERTFGPGELGVIEPGHDAEVVGDETVVFIDWGDVSNYAKSG